MVKTKGYKKLSFTYGHVAELVGLKPRTVSNHSRDGTFDPEDLHSLVEYINERTGWHGRVSAACDCGASIPENQGECDACFEHDQKPLPAPLPSIPVTLLEPRDSDPLILAEDEQATWDRLGEQLSALVCAGNLHNKGTHYGCSACDYYSAEEPKREEHIEVTRKVTCAHSSQSWYIKDGVSGCSDCDTVQEMATDKLFEMSPEELGAAAVEAATGLELSTSYDEVVAVSIDPKHPASGTVFLPKEARVTGEDIEMAREEIRRPEVAKVIADLDAALKTEFPELEMHVVTLPREAKVTGEDIEGGLCTADCGKCLQRVPTETLVLGYVGLDEKWLCRDCKATVDNYGS